MITLKKETIKAERIINTILITGLTIISLLYITL